jgi:hypothetical protein
MSYKLWIVRKLLILRSALLISDRLFRSATRVCTFGLTVRQPLITALSEGRGYGAAGGEGLFSSYKISRFLTHRCAVPPLPQAGEGCCQPIFRGETKMYKPQAQTFRSILFT